MTEIWSMVNVTVKFGPIHHKNLLCGCLDDLLCSACVMDCYCFLSPFSRLAIKIAIHSYYGKKLLKFFILRRTQNMGSEQHEDK